MESEQAMISHLGRQRPTCFASLTAEIMFCFSIVMSQILAEYFVSGFNVMIPTLTESLDIPDASSIWPSTALSLVVTSTLLIFGRLSDMFGGYILYVGGVSWLIVTSIIAGLSQNWLMLVIFRALQGLALAALLPSGIMILGRTYRPGPRKNLVFSIYGACAALGFFAGIFFAGVSSQFLSWRWYFFFGAIFAAVTLTTSIFCIPCDFAEARKMGVQMDWLGACFVVPGLVLVVFAIADSSVAPDGWRTPYIYVCFVLGFICLGVMVYVEGWVASNPLLPGDIFKVKYMKPLIISLLLMYGTLGIFLFYAVLYMENIMGATPLQVVAWTVPMAAGGLILSVVGGYILHILPGTILIILSCLGYCGSGLLFALIPTGGNYWAFVFPAMICATVGIDISFNVTNVFITTHLPSKRQGLAGALINSTLHLGIALMLGLSDILQSHTIEHGLQKSYKNVFWFQFGIAGLALVVILGFVRLRKAESELTADERVEANAVGSS